MTGASGYRRFLAAAILFTLSAGDFWRYLLSWWGWGAISLVLLALAIVELVRERARLSLVPWSLWAFLALAVVSIAWSAYPSATAVGVPATLATTVAGLFLALCLTWAEVIDALATASRWILGLSLLFELFVATVVREHVLPFWVDYSGLERIPNAFYWSRDLLFAGGRIQGIVGNANLLGMIALVALVVFLARLASRTGSAVWGWFWVAVAVLSLALTRSSTVLVAAAVTAFVALAALLVRRASGVRRIVTGAVAAALAAAAVVTAIALRGPLLALVGKSPDLTDRLDIWQAVVDLAVQRPAAGWGWTSWWAPWADPLGHLVVIRGVTYLQAHEAWLDVFLQLGILGLVAFGLLVLGTALRTWLFAVERDGGPTGVAIAPVALLTALLVQGLAESRLLVEIGWALLVVLAVQSSRTRALR